MTAAGIIGSVLGVALMLTLFIIEMRDGKP